MEISLHGLNDGPAVIVIARKLKRESAYDASYIALSVPPLPRRCGSGTGHSAVDSATREASTAQRHLATAVGVAGRELLR